MPWRKSRPGRKPGNRTMAALAQPQVKQYVRITFCDHAGKRYSWWAQKTGPRSFRKVNRDGGWGEDRKDRWFLGQAATEKPATMNPRYCQLETDTEKF